MHDGHDDDWLSDDRASDELLTADLSALPRGPDSDRIAAGMSLLDEQLERRARALADRATDLDSRRFGDRAPRRWALRGRAGLAGAAAAAAAVLFLWVAPRGPENPAADTATPGSDVAEAEVGLDVTAPGSFVVFQTENPRISVVWLLDSDGDGS